MLTLTRQFERNSYAKALTFERNHLPDLTMFSVDHEIPWIYRGEGLAVQFEVEAVLITSTCRAARRNALPSGSM